MNKDLDNKLARYKKAVASSDMLQMNLYVPKPCADKFLRMAKDSDMTPSEMFEKMVKSFGYGSFLK